jgi:uncharacterized membrane protein
MNETPVPFQTVPIRPVDCLKEAAQVVGDQYWLFVGICAVGWIIGCAAPFGILLGPMMCGIYLCYFKRMRGERIAFELLFKGFDYFVQSLIATLILMGVMMVIVIPLYILFFAGFFGLAMAAQDGNEGAAAAGFFAMCGLFYFLMLVVSLLMGTLFAFVYPLMVDRGLEAVPALKTSLKAVRANLGGMLGLVLLISLISLVAACFCYVPVIFVLPITFGAIALAYRKVFPDTIAP